MNVITCEGEWIQGAQGIECTGTLHSIPYQDVDVLFQEYLAPDPAIIGVVSGVALTLFVIGVSAGRVVQIMRKT
ncbi:MULTISPECIES: hypothetical protein [Marinobacter]|uniref:hypothetical protein n=1 Tax=Marinobacter TaxID=2742 RepID=UPI000D0FD1C7|nr:hypothetical protein [Marinobacter shengliensis]PSF14796.1 hypothetical protein C7H10_03670 [Marinobacter shengliensis]WBU40655.1 hypothetical protein PBN92_16375 [Marinobacter alkaliphilus]